jgi:predicted N-acetyltransferase YhbS
MQVTIRQEKPEDYHSVAMLIENAFRTEHFSDHQEQFLVDRLRKSTEFIPELSMVAEINNDVVGHILLTKININSDSISYESLALAPVSVTPIHQKKGIGGALINAAHTKAKELGFTSVVLLGHDTYYPKFGYELTSKYGIKFPFDIPDKYCMVKALTKDGLKGVSGLVEYPEAFY